ncbi:MAG TPA: oligosaccharide flippase family protein [Planctomycetaceae bacterium]|nr:oligosaccharide flippase family protein [Planctomycetaceae bacterium]
MTSRTATADVAEFAIPDRDAEHSLAEIRFAAEPETNPVTPPAAEVQAVVPSGSLRSNFWWMLSGNAVYALCQWGLLAILARLGTPAIVGQYVLAVAVTTPITVFFMLHLRAVQATDTRRDYEFGHYLALRLCAMTMALFVVIGVCLTSGYRGDTFLVIAAVAISAVCDSLSDIVYGLLQQRERLDRIGESMMLRGISSIILLSIVIGATGRVFYGILAVACARLVVLALFDLRNARQELARGAAGTSLRHGLAISIKPRWETRRILSLARVAFPLGLVMMLVVLSTNIPRYFVEHYVDQSALGIFGAIGYLSVAGTMAVGALGDSVTPRLARDYACGRRREFGIQVLRLAGLGAGLGIGGVLVAVFAGRPVLTLLYGPAYADRTDVLILTMVAAGIGYVASFSGYAVTAARFFRAQLPLFVAVALVTAAGCWWLVPIWGLRGAAVALALSSLTQLIGSGLILIYAVRADGGEQSTPLVDELAGCA